MKPSEKWIYDNYEVKDYKNVIPLLKSHYPDEWQDIKIALRNFRLWHSEVIQPGGNQSPVTSRMAYPFEKKGWQEVKARTKSKTEVGPKLGTKKEKVIFSTERSGSTHQIDLYKNTIGIEIMWNSKDGVFSRDLEVFRTLYNVDIINIGIIITRKTNLNAFLNAICITAGTTAKYNASSTHIDKLDEKLNSNGIGFPLIAFGISDTLYDSTK